MKKSFLITTVISAWMCSTGFASNHQSLQLEETHPQQGHNPKGLSSKTVVISLPQEDPVMSHSVINAHIYSDQALQEIIDEEIKGKPKYYYGYHKIDSLSVEEAESILKARVTTLIMKMGKCEAECNELLQKIFTSRHFEVKPQEIIDILALSEEEVFKFLDKVSYLNSAIFNSSDHHDHMAKEQHRIDPRVFLLPAETVRKWFYTHYNTWKKMPLEEYEAKDKALLLPQLFSTYFTFPEKHEERPAYYRHNALSFLTQKMIRDIRAVAQKIIDATTEQDRIVIFGNTPYFVGRAMEHLLQNAVPSNKRTLIYLPFSGAPNTRSVRNLFGASDDVVTDERFAHFKKRLETLGLSPENPSMREGTTYIVDVIGSGAGPAFTIKTILREFLKRNHETYPSFEIISLNKFIEECDRNMAIASKPADDGETTQLSFPSKEECHFMVPARVFYLEGHHHLDFIPDQCPATRIIPKFNPKFWSASFDHVLTAPLNSIAQILRDHFDENLKGLDQEQ